MLKCSFESPLIDNDFEHLVQDKVFLQYGTSSVALNLDLLGMMLNIEWKY